MKIHKIKGNKIPELVADDLIIGSIQDGIELIGNIYYQGYDALILHEANIIQDFFDLKTGMAGEILQKFSNYRVKLYIVGDFSRYTSKSLNDFILESNKGNQVNFITSIRDI